MTLETKIRNLIEEALNNKNIFIDSVNYVKEGSNYFLRVVIYTNDVMDVDTCVDATKIINPIIDESNLIDDAYILDVCSKERGEI